MADKKGVFYHPETGEVLNGLRQSLLSLDGRLEYPDPVPMAPVVTRVREQPGMRQMVQEMIRQEFSQLAEAHEMETFEEADDFEVGDEVPPPTDAELMALEGEARVRERRAAAAAPQQPAGEPGAAGGAAPPTPATKPTDQAVKPPEPIVKRSESVSSEAVAPEPKGS